MLKRTKKDINITASKKPRTVSSESCEKENLSMDEDSGLGPEITGDDENNDKMATSFGSQNSHFAAAYYPNITSKTPDFDIGSKSSETVAQRSTRSLSLQDTNAMKKLVSHEPNAFVDKSPRKLSLRPRKIRQSSTLNTSLLFEDAVNELLAISPPHDDHSSIEVDGGDALFSQFSATKASTDNFDINTILLTLETPLKNADPSKVIPVKIQSHLLENGNVIVLTDSSVSSSQANAKATEEEDNDRGDLFNETAAVNQEDAELPLQSHSHTSDDQYVFSASSHESSTAEMSKTKKKRRKNGMRFSHVKQHKTPIESHLVVDSYKPELSSDREVIVNNITMPKNFLSRLFNKITKIGLMKKIIINYYGRDRMPKIALKEPTRKYPGDIQPTLLVNESQVQDMIDLYNYYAPLMGLKGAPLPFKKVRQIIGNLCSQIRNFY